MQVESIPIADLHLDPANARKHPDRNLATIKASLARFKQQRPILIDSNNVVRAGNGTLMAARELGWRVIACVRSDLENVDLSAYSLVDNRSAEQGEWDDDILGETLKALQDADFDMTAVGYTADEIDAIFGNSPIESSTEAIPPNDFNAYDEAIETEYRCPKCAYSWSGKPK